MDKNIFEYRDFSFCEKDLLFLYEIVKQRPRFDPTFKLPSYEEHVKYMSKFEQHYYRWLIITYNEIDYAICYMSKKKELSLLSHLDLDITHEKNIKLQLKKFMYEKVQYLIESLNIEEFYAKSHKTNKIGINSFINFHKKNIINDYMIKIFNTKYFVNFILKKI